jgi:peptidoglycan hydrolase-like protein with peptidoglycan-binding domain
MPADATSGELTITLVDGAAPLKWPLAIGSLGPHKETKGAQNRLRNLGFECGKPDGTVGPGTKEAVQAFQKKNGLTAKGDLDDPTREKLLANHGV